MRRPFLAGLLLVLGTLAPAQTGPAGKWIRHDSEAGGFKVLFPAAPRETADTKPRPEGNVVSHMLSASTGEFFCGVGYTDYPVDLNVERQLVLDRDNLAKAMNATVSETHRTTFARDAGDRIPALNFMATNDRGTIKGLVLLVKRRVYIVVTFNRKGSDHTADIERFFGSFKLTSKKS
ncbi:MAG TPA: hypothetical protein VKE93_19745 [Candidatus Angelobacter sp.]|nr:hypothetical protein [Candidatus Angelobacter sp.]